MYHPRSLTVRASHWVSFLHLLLRFFFVGRRVFCAFIRMTGIVGQSEMPASTTTVYFNYKRLVECQCLRPQRRLHFQLLFSLCLHLLRHCAFDSDFPLLSCLSHTHGSLKAPSKFVLKQSKVKSDYFGNGSPRKRKMEMTAARARLHFAGFARFTDHQIIYHLTER